MLMKKPNHRIFDYTPRHYDPEKEEIRKKKLGFRSARKIRRKQKSPIYWLALLILILYMYLQLAGYFE